VIRKHIESTILHEISHVLPTSDEFAKEEEDEEESESSEEKEDDSKDTNPDKNGVIIEEDDEACGEELEAIFIAEVETQETNIVCESYQQSSTPNSVIIRRDKTINENGNSEKTKKSKNNCEKCVAFQPGNQEETKPDPPMISYEKVKRHKQRKERMYRKSLQKKPRAISAAKERRGVKVLGIILGCFTVCWTPFFVMYVVVQFCSNCNINPHIEMFITWLGYSNSAMNPIIYTVFNRDYQIALKRLFSNSPEKQGLPLRPNL